MFYVGGSCSFCRTMRNVSSTPLISEREKKKKTITKPPTNMFYTHRGEASTNVIINKEPTIKNDFLQHKEQLRYQWRYFGQFLRSVSNSIALPFVHQRHEFSITETVVLEPRLLMSTSVGNWMHFPVNTHLTSGEL